MARYPSHLISNNQSLSSNGFSIDSASMGWIVVGIGRLTGWATTTAEDVKEAEDFELFFPIGAAEPLPVGSVATAEAATVGESVSLLRFFFFASPTSSAVFF